MPAPNACTCVSNCQVGVLLLQHAFGPRCFIPKRFLPAKYEYFRAVTPRQLAGETAAPGDVETGDGSVECVICMNQVRPRLLQHLPRCISWLALPYHCHAGPALHV